MKITANEEYGLRIILRIAKIQKANPELDLVALNDIALAEGISYENTAAIVSKLKDSNLVESVRGKYGGYKLSRNITEINLYQIINALSKNTFDIDFCESHSGLKETCVHSVNCSVRPVWHSLSSLINNFLAGISLAQLLEQETEISQSLKELAKDCQELVLG